MCTTNSVLCNTINDYFSDINPIAQKIAIEIECTKAVYGDLWLTFSDKERTDIINDTLIKPDISLHYYNLFATATNSSRTSLNSIINGDTESSGITGANKTRKSYAYDGRNLNSFGVQKVGQKVMQDDVLGLFRDEHSIPFSYRTKSQINLLHKAEHGVECTPLLKSKAEAQAINNFNNKSLQNDLMSNNETTVSNKKIIKKATASANIFSNSSTMLADSNVIATKCKVIEPSLGGQAIKPMRDNTQSTQIKKHKQELYAYAERIDKNLYFDADERTNLIHSFVGSDSITSSISSATSDEEQFDDNDEKTLCEEVGLLDTDITLRKGFDFLNNW